MTNPFVYLGASAGDRTGDPHRTSFSKLNKLTAYERWQRLIAGGQEMIAHRGHSALAPENTIIAATAAAGIAHSTEFDLQVSSDGVVFLMHDATVNRTTNGGNVAVATLTAAALDALDAGSWFDATWFTGVKVPRLTDFLPACAEWARLFYPEIKLYRTSADIALMVQPFIDMGLEDRTVIQSFNHPDLAVMRSSSYRMCAGFLAGDVNAWASGLALAAADGNAVMIADYTMLLANPAFVTAARAVGVDVIAWTITTTTQVRDLAAIGVRRIMSDRLCHRLVSA